MVTPSPKLLSDDLEAESQKVRSMYESGTNFDWQDGKEDESTPHINIEETIGEKEEPPEELVLYAKIA